MNDIREAFQDGYMKGWDKCRENICEKYNLNKKDVMAWENSDKDVNCTTDDEVKE